MMLTLLALLVPGAVQDDVFKPLATGDRLEVTFRNGNTITGNLIPPLPQPGAVKRRSSRADAGGPPYLLYLFVDGQAGESASQVAAVDAWRKRHPEASVRRISRENQKEVWERYEVKSAPSVAFELPGGRVSLFEGFHSEDRLEEALGRFRAGSEGDGIDYSREPGLTLDISLEYPGLDGTMTVPKTEIRALRKLQKLDDATLKRLQDEKRKLRDELAREEASRRDSEKSRVEKDAAEVKESERLKKDKASNENDLKAAMEKANRIGEGIKLLERFPPPTWGKERLADIAKKGSLKLPVTPDERDFNVGYPLWEEALNYQKEQKEKGGTGK